MPSKQRSAEELEMEKKHAPTLPKQVRDQIAAMEAYTNPPAEPEEGDDVAPPVQQLQPGDPGFEKEGIPVQPQPTEVVPPVQPASPQPPAVVDESWEQRARSTQGRLEQVLQTNSTLQQRIASLENSIATLKAQGAAPAPAAEPKTPLRLVTPEEAADYGDEFLSVVGKRAKEEFAPEFELLASRLAQIEGRVEGVSTVISQNTMQGMYSALATAVPNWRQINVDQGFKDWLSVPDPFSGRMRAEMLKDAFSGHEANRVINFFRGYVEAAGLPQTSQANDRTAPPLPGNGQGSGKIPLEAYAAPGRARSAPQELPPDKPVYTNAWIATFMADKLAGKYRGREADADAIESDIYRAQHEGRIVP